MMPELHLDVIAMILTILGLRFSASKQMVAWPVWLVGNSFWIAHWALVYAGSGTVEIGSIGLNVWMIYENIRGWLAWRRSREGIRAITDTKLSLLTGSNTTDNQ